MSLPVISSTQLPADVRAATPASQQQYKAALGFEQTLLQQLTQSMAKTSGMDDSTSNPYSSLLPDAMASALTSNGGIGIAHQLWQAWAQAAAAPGTTPATPTSSQAPAAAGQAPAPTSPLPAPSGANDGGATPTTGAASDGGATP